MEIFIAQHGRCFYCTKPMAIGRNNLASYTEDHFYPKSKGNTKNGNVVLAHALCNLQKSDRDPTPEEVVKFLELYKKIKTRRGEIKAVQAEHNRKTE